MLYVQGQYVLSWRSAPTSLKCCFLLMARATNLHNGGVCSITCSIYGCTKSFLRTARPSNLYSGVCSIWLHWVRSPTNQYAQRTAAAGKCTAAKGDTYSPVCFYLLACCVGLIYCLFSASPFFRPTNWQLPWRKCADGFFVVGEISLNLRHQVTPCWSRGSKKCNHFLNCRRPIAGCLLTRAWPYLTFGIFTPWAKMLAQFSPLKRMYLKTLWSDFRFLKYSKNAIISSAVVIQLQDAC